MDFIQTDIPTMEEVNELIEMLKLRFSNLKITIIGNNPPYTVKIEDVPKEVVTTIIPIDELNQILSDSSEKSIILKKDIKISKTYKSKNILMNKVTIRSIEELLSHESIVREAYMDSKGIWTWSVGITSSSGHKVYPRYKDKPQSLLHCLEVFEWLIRMEYLPTVEEVFQEFDLTEEQIAAALSFHYNTGGLRSASWVKEWKKGNIEKAHKLFMNWKTPASIIPRRVKERDLFFNGKWSSNGKITEFQVKKPSYTPDWSSGRFVNIKSILEELFE